MPNDGGAIDEGRARDAGIDPAVLSRLLGSLDPDDRASILGLCASDLEKTRKDAWLALRRWDRDSLARQLHVMSSLAQTVGADALSDEARRMRARLKSGATAGYDANARRMDDLAERAAQFLSDASP